MKKFIRLRMLGVLALLSICSVSTAAQWEKKLYTEWSEREAQKLLDDSPWGKTQSFTASTELTGSGRSGSRETLTNSFQLNFHIRFFSAGPTRQALARIMELKQRGKLNEEMAGQLKKFAAGEFLELVVVTVSCDAEQPGLPLQGALAMLQKLTTADLKSNTFLEVAGQKVYLQEYQAPRNDGFGARFIFPRLVDNEPYISPKTNEVRFYSELSSGFASRSGPVASTAQNYTLNMRFKVSAMNFRGKLEY
jgi:hypothetical protein